MCKNGTNSSLIQVLVIGLIFDVSLFGVVIAHIRFVARLFAQITALEASTDMLLQSQRELNTNVLQFLSKTS